MKSKIRFLSLALCLVFVFSALGGCGKKPAEEVVVPPLPSAKPSFEETGKYIYKDGKSDYTIVYPAEPAPNEMLGVTELQNFFAEATGYELPAKTDEEVSYSESSRYLVIGEVNFLDEAGVGVNKSELSVSGFEIISKGESTFMLGGYYGTLYAVYDWLSVMLGFECYAADEIALQHDVTEVKLLNFGEYKQIPDIQLKAANYAELNSNTMYRKRMRNVYPNEIIGVLGQIYHNFEKVVDKTEHPEWYPYGYLCMTRDVEALSTYIADKIKEVLEVNKTSVAVTFSQIDSQSAWCGGGELCTCDEERAHYSTDSAAYIKLMNAVAEKVDAYLEETDPTREFYILLFAYNKSINAPAVKKEDGTYMPADESVKMNRRLGVMYAPFYTNQFFYSLKDTKNSVAMETLEKWAACTDTIFYWSYNLHFKADGALDPFYNVGTLKDNVEILEKIGCKYWYDQADDVSNVLSDWSRLKIYLQSKLSWDKTADINELTDAFFDNYFKDASANMRKYYDEFVAHFAILMSDYSTAVTGFPEENVQKAEYWPYKMLLRWCDYMDAAKEDIMKYKLVDEELYQKLYDRIVLESISVRRMILRVHSGMFETTAEREQFARELLNDANAINHNGGLDIIKSEYGG